MDEVYIVIILCMSMMIFITSILFTIVIIKTTKTFYKDSESEKREIKRKHPNNSKVNFASQLVGRKDIYSKYKNKDGLYEPQTGKKGIEIKIKNEEE